MGIVAEKKEKQYVSDNAQLMEEWNWERNTDVDPSKLTLGNKKKVWWKCPKGHEWQSAVSNRNKGSGCPYCSGRYSIKGKNDLKTINPTLAEEWNYEKNTGLTPMDILPSSNKKVWWKCPKGHEWVTSVANRSKGNGCPYCSNKIVLKGENDLETVDPTLAKEWNYIKNGNLKPNDFSSNSGQKVWWKCDEGHEWQATIDSRNNGHGCPFCAGQKALKGENDLQTVNPTLAKEWNYEKNNGLTPMDVLPSSNKKVWWKCKKGHEWQSSIKNRNKGVGCPVCNSERNTSFPEYAILYYLKKQGLDAIHSYRDKGYELDIYIPSKNVAIEYDGHFWHKKKAKIDLEKNKKCLNDGIILYRIREGLPSLNDSSIDYVIQEKQKDLQNALEEVLSQIIGKSVGIDLEKDAMDIENLREYTEKANSLLISNPTVAEEWNYEKNGTLKPEYFSVNSHKKVWWQCKNGHEWQAPIGNRNIGRGCPYCAGQRIVKGENDLQTVNPILAKDWNYEKNKGLTPMDVTPNSHKKVWWSCSKGHEWQAVVASRNRGSGCPYCSGRKKQ